MAEQAESPGGEPAHLLSDTGTTKSAGARWFSLSAETARFLWPVLCLLQFGLLLGATVVWLGGKHEGELAAETSAPMVPAQPVRGAPPVLPAAVAPAPGDIARADELLRGSWYEAALAVYQPPGGGPSPSPRAALSYRVALCLEGLGRWDQALAAFREAASHAATPQLAAAAQLGQARVQLRRHHPGPAKTLLCALLLRSAQPALRDQPFLVDARYLLALALALETNQPSGPDPLHASTVTAAGADWPLEGALDWITPSKDKGADNSGPAKDTLVVLKRDGAGEPKVRASLEKADVRKLLERLAKQAELRVDWTIKAQEQAAGRTATVLLDTAPLSEVFRLLLEPLGLTWNLDGGLVTFSGANEAGATALAEHRRAAARHGLRDVIQVYPNHSLTAVAYLEAGNLEAAAGKLKDAVTWYERLTREAPRVALATEAHYNLALARHRLGDYEAARRAFFAVVDRAPGHELAPLAYLRIGYVYLEMGDPDRAISPLRRALAAAPGSPAQPAAAVALAACYLLTNNPGAARAIIVENRSVVGTGPFRALASFIESFARYRAVAADPRAARREAGDLLAALLLVADGSALAPVGDLLLGQAYRELGMGDRMAAVYEKALLQARGPLAAEMAYTLADYLFGMGKVRHAKQRLTVLARADHGDWTVQAQRRLAEIALHEKQPLECLRWCKIVLEERRAADVSAILRVMGRGFEMAGDYRQAALCFAGQLPDP